MNNTLRDIERPQDYYELDGMIDDFNPYYLLWWLAALSLRTVFFCGQKSVIEGLFWHFSLCNKEHCHRIPALRAEVDQRAHCNSQCHGCWKHHRCMVQVSWQIAACHFHAGTTHWKAPNGQLILIPCDSSGWSTKWSRTSTTTTWGDSDWLSGFAKIPIWFNLYLWIQGLVNSDTVEMWGQPRRSQRSFAKELRSSKAASHSWNALPTFLDSNHLKS